MTSRTVLHLPFVVCVHTEGGEFGAMPLGAFRALDGAMDYMQLVRLRQIKTNRMDRVIDLFKDGYLYAVHDCITESRVPPGKYYEDRLVERLFLITEKKIETSQIYRQEYA